MKYVGLDVHKDSIAVAIAEGSAEVRFYGEISATVEALRNLRRRSFRNVGLIRFRGHFPKGGYDVHDGRQAIEALASEFQ
jgi:hypothetical protein